jgi:anti-sigma B factor antagonist
VDAAPDFDVRSEQAGSATVVVCRGELDLYTAPELAAELEAAITAGARQVVVDLTGASFVDSTAIGALLRSRARLGARFGTLALVCSDAAVLRAFEVTGLDRLFAIHQRREDAFEAGGCEKLPPRDPETYEALVVDLDREQSASVAAEVQGDS